MVKGRVIIMMCCLFVANLARGRGEGKVTVKGKVSKDSAGLGQSVTVRRKGSNDCFLKDTVL